MIPALGTCFFVYYLYKSLNADPPAAVSDDESPAALNDRLVALQSRLQALLDSESNGGAKS